MWPVGWEALEQWGADVACIEPLAGGVANDVWSLRVYGRLAVGLGAVALVAAGFIMPCIPIQRTKASNQPVLVVSFGYIPKPWPPCS